MSRRPPLPPGPFLLVGLARSGRAAGPVLRALGEEVTGCDSGPVDAAVRAELEAAGVAVHEATDGVALLDGVRTLVKSPGVPQEARIVRAARERGVLVIGELELGWRLLPNDVIAITGSNGKTTTTELVGQIHREAGLPVAVAGNVGTALTTLAGTLDPAAVVICEASSFQLEDTVAFAPDAAVLLNLAPDHLDRHGTFAAYRGAKLQIFAHQDSAALAVLPAGLDPGGAARTITFASPMRAGISPAADLIARDGELVWRGEPVVAIDAIRLRGTHNVENAMAAAAVTLGRGIDPAALRAALARFAGVAHRLEEVGRIEGVLFVDDSKATNVASAVVGIRSFPRGVDPAAVRAALAGFAGVAHRLEEIGRLGDVLFVDDSKATNVASAVVGVRSFPGRVHVILGGRGKREDYAPLAAAVAERCRAAYLIGEEAARMAPALAGTGVPVHDCGDLERAVAAARAAAGPGDVVLLSPACASYDQYRSYEQRGEHFKALAHG